jgi:hypothetical protein
MGGEKSFEACAGVRAGLGDRHRAHRDAGAGAGRFTLFSGGELARAPQLFMAAASSRERGGESSPCPTWTAD